MTVAAPNWGATLIGSGILLALGACSGTDSATEFCLDGQFDLNGRNIAGPPPGPLEAFDVRLRGEDIIVTRPS